MDRQLERSTGTRKVRYAMLSSNMTLFNERGVETLGKVCTSLLGNNRVYTSKQHMLPCLGIILTGQKYRNMRSIHGQASRNITRRSRGCYCINQLLLRKHGNGVCHSVWHAVNVTHRF